MQPQRHDTDLTEVEQAVCRSLAAQPRGAHELTVPEIAQAIDEVCGPDEFIPYSDITAALRALRRDGYINRRRLREPGEPYARVYWLTPAARDATASL